MSKKTFVSVVNSGMPAVIIFVMLTFVICYSNMGREKTRTHLAYPIELSFRFAIPYFSDSSHKPGIAQSEERFHARLADLGFSWFRWRTIGKNRVDHQERACWFYLVFSKNYSEDGGQRDRLEALLRDTFALPRYAVLEIRGRPIVKSDRIEGRSAIRSTSTRF